jgi:ABC-2 type transport system permease protein
MNLRAVYAIALRQFYLLRGSPTRILPIFAWVAIDIVLWGFITRYLNSVGGAGFNFVPVLLGAVLFWDFFTRVMQGVTTAFFEDIWSRNFLNVFAAPLSIGEYLGGLVLTSILTSVLALVAMLALASSVFGLQFAAFGLWLMPWLLVLFLFGIALGILAAAMVLRLGPASEWLVWPIPALLAPFAGVFYPLATLPAWMRAVAYVLPPSYVFEGMRALLAGQAPAVRLLWAGFGLALLQILLAAWVFRAVHRHTVRTGLLARYSAESM